MISDLFIEAVAVFLNMKKRDVEHVLYFGRYLVVEPGFTPFEKNQVVNAKAVADAREKYCDDFIAANGEAAIQYAIRKMDTKDMIEPERLSKIFGIHSLYLGMLLCLDYCVVVASKNIFYSVGQFISPHDIEMAAKDKRVIFASGEGIIKNYLIKLLWGELEEPHGIGENENRDAWGDDGDVILHLPLWSEWARDMEEEAERFTQQIRSAFGL